MEVVVKVTIYEVVVIVAFGKRGYDGQGYSRVSGCDWAMGVQIYDGSVSRYSLLAALAPLVYLIKPNPT